MAALGLPDLTCLTGGWELGSVLVTAAPSRVVTGPDAFTAVGAMPAVDGAPEVRVGGGWFGRLGWTAAASRMAWHDWVLRRDAGGAWCFEALGDDDHADLRAALQEVLASEENPSVAPGRLVDVEVDPGERHVAAVAALQEEIAAGEVYQANLCTRLRARVDGDAYPMWLAATATLQPRYGAWLPGDTALAAWSPELFLRRSGSRVESAPIKGTRPRSADPAELRDSAKERAEHIMIVDLVRNDLGRVCVPGSVTVPQLLAVEPAPGVWHLVSRVAGELAAEVDDAALLAATFPPGSVSGAPKGAALQQIARLEAWPRLAYTGAYGVISPIAGAELAVTIRTLEVGADGSAWLGAGGGITAGSDPAAEWQECLLKAGPLLDACGATSR